MEVFAGCRSAPSRRYARACRTGAVGPYRRGGFSRPLFLVHFCIPEEEEVSQQEELSRVEQELALRPRRSFGPRIEDIIRRRCSSHRRSCTEVEALGLFWALLCSSTSPVLVRLSFPWEAWT